MSDGLFVSQGKSSALNLTLPTVVNAGVNVGLYSAGAKGRIQRVQVLVAGTTPGGVYDASTAAAAIAAVQLAAIPNVIGAYLVDMPFFSGLVVMPGTGQTLAVSFD